VFPAKILKMSDSFLVPLLFGLVGAVGVGLAFDTLPLPVWLSIIIHLVIGVTFGYFTWQWMGGAVVDRYRGWLPTIATFVFVAGWQDTGKVWVTARFLIHVVIGTILALYYWYKA
jgi:hypothetical protein